MGRSKKVAIALVAAVLCVAGWNYFTAMLPVSNRLAEDSRNQKVSFWVYHRFGVLPSTLVVDLRSVNDEAAPLDVLRALLHSAEALKDSKFDRVVLAHRGTGKFMLDGKYFYTLGQEFKTQNPVYTLRTLPENVFKLDGTHAYGTWTGGMLGVLTKQMEDVTQFSRDWYIDELAKDSAKR